MSSVHTTLPCLPSSLQVKAFQVKKSSIKNLERQFPNVSLKWASTKSRNHQSCTPVCLFGGGSKGKSNNGNEVVIFTSFFTIQANLLLGVSLVVELETEDFIYC